MYEKDDSKLPVDSSFEIFIKSKNNEFNMLSYSNSN